MTAILVTLAIGLDFVTANPDAEANPLARAILAGGFGLATKAAELALVLAVVALLRPGHARLAGVVAGVAVVVGFGGAWSNVA